MRSKERRRCRQSGSRPGRRFLALAAAALGIGACSVPPPTVVLAPTGFVQGFVGGIAADEPRATVVALQTLTGGGTAADGAVALTFALGVTYPVAAGLGGGGVCLVYDGAAGTLESLDFLPRAGAAGGPVAVPGTARGMAALHARYGRVAWEDLVVQAEGLARRGAPVSPALARHLGEAAAALAQDPDLAAMFTGTGGAPVATGSALVQIELAETLAQIRVRGAEDFYTGQAAQTLLAGAAEKGATLSRTDLAAYAPAWSDTLSLELAGIRIHVVPGAATGGVVAGQLWAMLAGDDRYASGAPEVRAHLFAEASARAYGDRGNRAANPLSLFRAQALMADVSAAAHVPHTGGAAALRVPLTDAGATGFVVMDRAGGVVACTLTMGQAFGTRRSARPTGVILATTPAATETQSLLAPVIAFRAGVPGVALAAAAGGPAGPAALAQVLLNADAGLAAAVAAPRLLHPGSPDRTAVEARASALGGSLAQRGHVVAETPDLGAVNGVACSVAQERRSCAFVTDPRGRGLGAAGDPGQ